MIEVTAQGAGFESTAFCCHISVSSCCDFFPAVHFFSAVLGRRWFSLHWCIIVNTHVSAALRGPKPPFLKIRGRTTRVRRVGRDNESSAHPRVPGQHHLAHCIFTSSMSKVSYAALEERQSSCIRRQILFHRVKTLVSMYCHHVYI